MSAPASSGGAKTDEELAEWWLNESMDEDAIGHVKWPEAPQALRRLLESVRAEEREACAKAVEAAYVSVGNSDRNIVYRDEVVALIRARTTHPRNK